MNRETNNRSIKNIPDLFDEALELEETIVQPSLEEAELPEEMTAETAGITADPTFFDEQVINVPIIDPPDMKSISSYPDTQIYDHLFSTDDDFLLDDEMVEDVVAPINENPAVSETAEPETIIDEVVPIIPEPEPAPAAVQEPVRAVAGKKPSKKPPVKRAGMPKEEAKREEPAVIEEIEKPVRKKPRVRRASDTVSTTRPAAEAKASPPFSLMGVDAPKKASLERPVGKSGVAQKKQAGNSGVPQKKLGGGRPTGHMNSKPAGRPEPKAPSAMPQRSKSVDRMHEAEKAAQKKRPFSALEKMKQKLAQKWS